MKLRVTYDVDKSSDAFRTISEVATDLDLPQHVLRFWETRFAQIKPLKRGGGRRYYRPDDVDLLKGIRHLLYGEGYTIRGVQRILKEQGVRFVMALWQEGAPGLQGLAPRDERDADADAAEPADEEVDWGRQSPGEANDLPAVPLRLTRGDDRGAAVLRHTPLDRARQAALEASRTVSLVPVEGRGRQAPEPGGSAPVFFSRETLQTAERQSAGAGSDVRHSAGPGSADDAIMWSEPEGEDPSPAAIAQRFAPRNAAPAPNLPPLMSRATPTLPVMGARADLEAGEPRTSEWAASARPAGTTMETFRPPARPGAGTAAVPTEPEQGLSRDEIRRLQATLFELLECKRLLDQTR